MHVLEQFGALGLFLPLFILILLGILLPVSAYAAQKWANKTYKETIKTNQKLDEIIALLSKTDSR
jgi:hypothetical protein